MTEPTQLNTIAIYIIRSQYSLLFYIHVHVRLIGQVMFTALYVCLSGRLLYIVTECLFLGLE